MIKNATQRDAFQLVFWQFIVVCGLALILLCWHGAQSGMSALLGGLAYVLPNVAFVWRVFTRTSAQAATRFLVAFVMGEVAKLFTSAILFVLIVKYLQVNLLAVLGGYVTAIVAFWLVSIVFLSQEHPGDGQ